MYVAFIDHYDSFSFNIVDWLIRNDFLVEYFRFDDLEKLAILANHLRPLVLSPGPGHPDDYASSLTLVRQASGRVPILGICLGHQILSAANGANIVRSRSPFHGSTKRLDWHGHHNFENSHYAVSYNSLAAQFAVVPAGTSVMATSDGGEAQVIAIKHENWNYRALGIQFHPESYAGSCFDFLLAQLREDTRLFWDSKRNGPILTQQFSE
jgi:anthranilate synthase/aminodeoxychorismate synthase-like glutamine amidotransferase